MAGEEKLTVGRWVRYTEEKLINPQTIHKGDEIRWGGEYEDIKDQPWNKQTPSFSTVMSVSDGVVQTKNGSFRPSTSFVISIRCPGGLGHYSPS